MDNQIKDQIYTHLQNRGYKDATVKSYASHLLNLFRFFPNTAPEQISQEQVLKYMKSLKAQNKHANTIRGVGYAFDFYYNDILGKNHRYPFKHSPPPSSEYNFFTQDQVFKMIDGCSNIKHKCILMCLYSMGLTSGELQRLKVQDIRSREQPHVAHIRDSEYKVYRKAFLSPQLLRELRKYSKGLSLKSDDFLFHNPQTKNRYASNSITKILDAALKANGLNPELKVKDLRYSYFKHMIELGVPLSGILISMGLVSPDSMLRYHKIIYANEPIRFSPLDRVITLRKASETFDTLEDLVRQLHNEDIATYLKEAIDCLRIGALRAGVIFVWNAAISKVHEQLAEPEKLPAINTHLREMNSRTKVSGIDDFQKLKDETVLILTEKMGIFDKAEKDILSKSCLDLRNKCGHPSKYQPEIHKVKAFVEDVVNIVFK